MRNEKEVYIQKLAEDAVNGLPVDLNNLTQEELKLFNQLTHKYTYKTNVIKNLTDNGFVSMYL